MDEKKALKELKLQSLVLESRIQCNREIEEFVSSALLEQRKNAIDIGIKALETMSKIAEIVKIEQQATSCEDTKLKSFEMIEKIIADYQLNQ